MRFGVVVPRYDVGFGDVVGLLGLVEEWGFDSVWVTDHLQTGRGRFVLEAWTLLSAIAPITRRVRLGTVVLCYTYRHPSVLAKMVATLDNVSGGRLELGLGIGSQQQHEEHRALGMMFPNFRERMEWFREYVEVVRLLLSCGSRVSFGGRYYRLDGADCNCPTVQKPYPPMWIGARRGRMIKMVAEIGEGWNFYGESIEEFERAMSKFIKACESVGKDYRKVRKSVFTSLFIYENHGEKRERLERFMSGTGSEEELLRRTNTLIYGGVDECIERIDRLAEIGAELVILRDLTSDFRNLRNFASKVMPSFSKKT